MPNNLVLSIIGGVISLLTVLLGGAFGLIRYLKSQWNKIENLKKQVKTLEKQVKTLEKLNDQLNPLLDVVRETKARLDIERRRSRDFKNRLGEALSEKEKLHDERFHLENENRRTQAHVDKLARQNAEQETKISVQGIEIESLRRIRLELSAEIEKIKRQLEEHQITGGSDPKTAAEMNKKAEELFRLGQELLNVKESLEKTKAELESQRRSAAEQDSTIELLRVDLQELEQSKQAIESTLDEKIRALEHEHDQNGKFQTQIEDLKKDFSRQQNVKDSAFIWERPVRDSAPRFVPLKDRIPIISVINLKGGVGKTTISANLAAALGLRDSRVLLIDCDYQRSLTGICIRDEHREELHRKKRTLQHFILGEVPDLLHCAVPVEKIGHCKVIINTESKEVVREPADSFEETEMYLQAQWVMQPHGPDVRLLLRKALHSPALYSQFDYVVLDCPPRLSTACINALAGSDFALVPVELDSLSTVSVPNLLRKLKRLKDKGLFPHLNILGILANVVRFLREQPIKSQKKEWADLPIPCELAWGERVDMMNTMIKHDAAFAEALERRTFAALLPTIKPIFNELTEEVAEKISKVRINQ